MALRWDFKKDRIGTAIIEDGTELRLYNGNAFIIALYEWEKEGKELYQLMWFFADEEHAKNCMGLSKDYEGCWKDFQIKKIELDVTKKETEKFLKLLCKAKAEIEITLYKAPF